MVSAGISPWFVDRHTPKGLTQRIFPSEKSVTDPQQKSEATPDIGIFTFAKVLDSMNPFLIG